MGTVCPQGHDSASSDFCDVCGTRISSSLTRPDGMLGKHHAAGRFVASGGDSCARCGSAVTGQFCEVCGFRVSARRPFAPLGDQAERSSPAPAEAWETVRSGSASSGPPESLFPPIPKSEPPFSAWSRPQPFPSSPSPSSQPPSSQPPPAAPGGQSARPSVPQAADVPGAPETPEQPGVAGLLESLFSPAPRTSPRPMASAPPASAPPPMPTPPAARPEPPPAPPVWPDPAPAPASRPEPPTGPQVRAEPPAVRAAGARAPARAFRAAVLV